MIDANTKEGLRLLGVYTAGYFDVWRLAGNARASVRAHIMSALMGKRMPQSKSGIHAIQEHLYVVCGIEGTCPADREDKLRDFAKANA